MSLRDQIGKVVVDHFAFLVHHDKFALAQELLTELGWTELVGDANKGDGWKVVFYRPEDNTELRIQLTQEDDYLGSRVECLPGVHLGLGVEAYDAIHDAQVIADWASEHGLRPTIEAANERKTKIFVIIPDLWTITLEIVAYGPSEPPEE